MSEHRTSQDHQGRPVKTATEARGGRVVRGGAMARVVMISVAVAILAMFIAFMVVR